MARIIGDGDFKLRIYKMGTFPTKMMTLNGKEVAVNLDRIQISYCGEVKVWVGRHDRFIKYTLLQPMAADKPYIESMFKIFEQLSNDRIEDKKSFEKKGKRRVKDLQ